MILSLFDNKVFFEGIICDLLIFGIINVIIIFVSKIKDVDIDENDKITFKFKKRFKIGVLIYNIIIFMLWFNSLFHMINKNDKSELAALIIMIMVNICSIILYLFVSRKKIVYYNDNFYLHNIFNKERIYNCNEIKDAFEIKSDGIKITFIDNRKLKFDKQMINYDKVKSILLKYGISVKEK